MKKSTPITIPRIFVFAVCLTFSSAGGPFDWNYNYLSTPFAIFYNPSLLGNNAGYTFGVNGHYIDSSIYNGRMALVVPVSRAAALEDHAAGNNGYLRYANTSHMSSRHAVSIGGEYIKGGDYRAIAGFTAPVSHVQTGASVEYAQNDDDDPRVSLNAGLSANLFDRMIYLSLHNVWTNDRADVNLFGVSLGGAAALYSNPYAMIIPVEAIATTYFNDGGKSVNRLEGTARLTFDFTPVLTGREKTGHTAALSLGYSYVRYNGGAKEHKIFASFGMILMGRSSSCAVLGGYGRKGNKTGNFDTRDGTDGAVVYNMFRESSVSLSAAAGLKIDLKHSETDDGRILFHLECRGGSVESWVLRIDAQNDRSVKTFSGGNTIPTAILWDLTDSSGESVKNDPVRAKLIVIGKNSVVTESEWILITPVR